MVGTPRAGATVTIHPTIADTDVQRVEYTLGAVFLGAVTVAPFDRALALPSDTSSTTATAVAFDLAGNRSSAITLPIAIQAARPPVVTLTNLAGVTTAGQNQTISFEVRVSGDSQLAQVFFTAVGAASASFVARRRRARSFVQTFSVTVPAGAVSNRPSSYRPRQPIHRVAKRSGLGDAYRPRRHPAHCDRSGPVTMPSSSPAQASMSSWTRPTTRRLPAWRWSAILRLRAVDAPIAAGIGNGRQTFTVLVPANLQAPQTLTLSIVAVDTAGNTTRSDACCRSPTPYDRA